MDVIRVGNLRRELSSLNRKITIIIKFKLYYLNIFSNIFSGLSFKVIMCGSWLKSSLCIHHLNQHFIASTLMAPFQHQFATVVQN